MIAVECIDVTKSYGDKETSTQALRGISLEAYAGELLMLVGPSGCGKTTLLSIISGIMRQDSGMCYVYGQDLSVLSQTELTAYRGANIGFIFQHFNLIPTLTAIENVSIPLVLSGVEKSVAFEHAEKLLERVGLSSRKHAYPPHMSGGEQQRIAICRGCVHAPRLIVCDEPTSALDHHTGIEVLKLFRDIALSRDSSLIIVTHDARIFDFADRILRLDDGRIVSVKHNHHSPPS
ncbi:MAG: ABC transporter ATP-binding protein [Verrucomicrobia bacterium]|nr:ABC transporter ATP-binding protein [Verrucomicrobiota bacterium]MBS0645681.1 ABC transporter ATP-binding protein [Verrucomicrobiota bacterium]